ITFRYQELSDRGVPRFPSFVRVQPDAVEATPIEKSSNPSQTQTATPSTIIPNSENTNITRRFEYKAGASSKFWEMTTAGSDVTVRYGRIGTTGQTQAKSFADGAAAQTHADKLIAEKTKKGYKEVVAN